MTCFMLLFSSYIIFMYTIHLLECCGPYYDYYADSNTKTKKSHDAAVRNEKNAWRGWTPSAKTKQEWHKWMAEYNKKYQNTDNDYDKDLQGNLPERGADRGWPDSWKGLGSGNPGVDPPPWAYVPKNLGRPNICSRRPIKGPCNETLTRWGFNSFTEKCEKYIYSGCNGSPNNFKDKKKCVEVCLQPISSGCDQQTQIREEDIMPADGPG